MTGCFLRVERDYKFQNIEIEHLTKEEIEEVFLSADKETIIKFMVFLCEYINRIEQQLKEICV